MSIRKPRVLVAGLLALGLAASQVSAQPAEDIAGALRGQLPAIGESHLAVPGRVREFYEQRGHRPASFADDRFEDRLKTLAGLLSAPPGHGLPASRCHLDRIEAMACSDTLPVYLVYWTAWVDYGGVVHFRDDIYGLDGRLQSALNLGRWQLPE